MRLATCKAVDIIKAQPRGKLYVRISSLQECCSEDRAVGQNCAVLCMW